MAEGVFVTGGTGYVGRPLIEELVARGHPVRALVRASSRRRLPAGAVPVTGNALDADSFADAIAPARALVHLVGTPHPSPAKARLFREVDLVSIRASVAAAVRANVRHLVYMSVAQPAPVMKAYIKVRQQGERLIRESAIPATILRPWYVLGPGHRWPCLMMPAYRLLEWIPVTRETALRLGLVSLRQMVMALVDAVEHPPQGVRVIDVSGIRDAARRM